MRGEFGLSELLLGLIASGTFAGYLLGLLAVPRLAARRGPRAPTTVGGVCGVIGATTVALAPSPAVLAVGAVLAGSAAGWVWAPYSDIVTRVVPERRRPTLLAVITTGTSVGLVGLAALGLLGAATSWRLTWAGIAVAAALATLLNRRKVPRLEPRGAAEDDAADDGDTAPDAKADGGGGKGDVGQDDTAPRSLWRRTMTAPLAFTVVYFAAITAYFTYASEAASAGGLATSAAPVLFAVIGVGGLAGLGTGRVTGPLGTTAVGVGSVLVVSGALALLSLGRASLPLVLLSALLFGTGFMVGSSLLAIWTAQAVPDRPAEGFTLALVLGAVVSIATPAAMGALIPAVGLPGMLVAVAVVAAVGAAVVPLLPAGGSARSSTQRGADSRR